MRRVAFSTISQTVESNGNLNSTKTDLLSKKKTVKKDDEERALRFEINLNLSDASNDNCPEFSYAELVKEAESNNADLPTDLDSIYDRAEDDKLKEIAKSFERKYASTNKKKKYKKSYEDYIDKGLGYDETDSFIDNQEAYDELIPSTITTKYGGFYINFGKLEFRACSDEEDDAIADDDEEDDDSRDFRTSTSKKRKNKSNDLNQSKKRKKKIIESDDDEDDNQNDNSRDLDSDEEELDNEDSESISSSSNSQQQSPLIKKKKNHNKNNPNQIIDNIIDSVVKKVNKNGNSTTQNSSIKLNSQTNDLKDEDAFRISDQLPANIKDKLTQLKNLKLNTPDNKKARNYSDDIYKLVFDADNLAQGCSSSVRIQVQSWFTNYLAISKDTLIKRLKKMKITSEEMKLKQNVSTLRMEVSYLIEECEEAYEAKLAKWEEDKKNGLHVDEPPEDLDKEFKFNDKVRDLLRKILNSKRLLVDLAGIKGKQEEDNITNYFNNEIKNIWPPNWISNSTLLKVAGFISKYNNQASDKSSVSVIKKSPTRPTNSNTSSNTQQQSNVPKLTQINSHNNNGSSTKTKHHHNQPKDLSIDKSSSKHDKSSNHNSQQMPHLQQVKTESLLSKKQQNEQHQKLLNNNQLDNNFSQQPQQKQQYSLNSMNKNHGNFIQQSNIEQMQQKISQQLKEHNSLAKNLKQIQQQQQQFASQQQSKNQQKNASTSLDKSQNLTNYALVNNLSSQNSSKKQQSSSPFNDLQRQLHSSTPTTSHHNLTSLNNSTNSNKYIDQKPFQMPSNSKMSSSNPSKQSINKSLEVDYKFDKAIKKSLIDEQIKQNLNLPLTNQFHRSSSMPNNNLVQQQQQQQQQNTQSNSSHSKQQQQQLTFNQQQQQQSKSPMNPKPAHSNNNSSHSLPSGSHNSNNNLYPNQLQAQQHMIHQLAMQQYISEALKIYQQGGLSGQEKKAPNNNLNTSSNSLNNFNYGKNFNTGNNNQQQTQISNSQSYISSSSSNSLVSNKINNQMNSQISNQINVPVSNSLAFKSQSNQKTVKNDFDINSIINDKPTTASQFYSPASSASNPIASGNRYSSPNQLNSTNPSSSITTSASLTPQPNYQKAELASLNSDKNYDPNSIYSDYMNSLNSQAAHQQQLYQRNIQQRQDGNLKFERNKFHMNCPI